MSKSNIDIWMPIHIGEHLAETIHLSTEEQGAYLLLKMYYWKNGGAIKNDKNSLKNITKISSKKLQNILSFFEEKNGILFHHRLDELLEEARINADKQRARTASATQAAKEKRERDSIRNGHRNGLEIPSVTDTVTMDGTESTTTQTSNVVYNKSLSYSPRDDEIVDNFQGFEGLGLDFNDIDVCYTVVCGLLGKNRLEKMDSDAFNNWFLTYDMENLLTKVKKEITKRVLAGKKTNSLRYFYFLTKEMEPIKPPDVGKISA